MKKINIALILIFLLLPGLVFAHRSGCHRWHSCPSDSGSYTCGDAGYPCQYPTYPSSGGVVYPPSGYYKDCYDCPIKKVPTNASASGYDWSCNAGYVKKNNECITHTQNCNNYYGDNLYGVKDGTDNSSCYCNVGYSWNVSKTSCISDTITCPANSTLLTNDKCYCGTGYEINASKTGCQKVGTILGSNYSKDNPLGLISGWLIKNNKFAEVFSVDDNLCLHWIRNEDAAERFYGPTWNDYGVIKEFDEIPATEYKFCENID